MKKLLLLFLVGCGPTKQFCQVNDDFLEVCNGVFGYNNEQSVTDRRQDDNIRTNKYAIEQLTLQLQSQVQSLYTYMNYINGATITKINELQNNNYSNLQSQITSLQQLQSYTTSQLSQLSINSSAISQLQTQVVLLQSQIAQLQSNSTVVSTIDFCGDAPNKVDEVGLKLSDGSVIVYFENGGKRFLTKLYPGNFTTTDGTNCHFTVDNNLNISY